MAMPATFVQIILAAGQSKRMGSLKALLDFDGVCVLRRLVDAAHEAGVPETIVVLGPGGAGTPGAVDLTGRSVSWVVNPVVGSAQLTSLQCAVQALPETAAGFIFQPVDFPLVQPADYRLLLDAAAEHRDSTVFYLSHKQRKGHPVLCRRAVGERILRLGRQSAREVLAQESDRYVLTDNGGVLEDMDTPADYEHLLKRFREREGSNPEGS